MANWPLGATDFLTSDDEVWVSHHVLRRRGFSMPSGGKELHEFMSSFRIG